MLQVIPANRLMLAFGAFGYEWNDADGAPQATAMTYAEAIAAARQHHVLPQWNADLMQPSIQWIDADSTDHVLWYLDAVTSWNALQSASSLGVAGEAVWRLGAEDPSLWRIFGRNTSPWRGRNSDRFRRDTAWRFRATGSCCASHRTPQRVNDSSYTIP